MGTEPLSTVLLLSVLVEIVTDSIKSALSIRGQKSKLIALCVGIITCLTTQIGLLSQLDIAIKYNTVDYILTGIIISRGSHAIHDIFSIFERNNPTQTQDQDED
ncbi:hypothetical protein [Fuchsiella alkaliacetigena]|uniref:hypothetical protein n=1 Tax=Fuchsiella alkaliacetigena TaxID=957042 RepID=UPI00200B015F|nr:hypothetical protein [Fuchsiella alkaliacetigena]MCK8825235.1 hypothetical protein [Fuchsiella alkaliacetigena]